MDALEIGIQFKNNINGFPTPFKKIIYFPHI